MWHAADADVPVMLDRVSKQAAFAAIFLVSCSKPADPARGATISRHPRQHRRPRRRRRAPDACVYLAENAALKTTGWKDDGLGHGCNSPYWKLGDGAMPNNLAYYVTGEAERATTLKLVLNVNDRANAVQDQKTLADTAATLATRAGETLPKSMRSALERGAPVKLGRFEDRARRLGDREGIQPEVLHRSDRRCGRGDDGGAQQGRRHGSSQRTGRGDGDGRNAGGLHTGEAAQAQQSVPMTGTTARSPPEPHHTRKYRQSSFLCD